MSAKPEPLVKAPAQPPQAVEQFFQVSLLGLVSSGFLALAFSGYLDAPTIALTSLGLLIRAVAVFGKRPLLVLAPAIANALTLAYIGFYPLDYTYISQEFIPATVHLVCFLSIIRIHSAKTNRDYFFVKLLAFLELVAATLLSSNVSFFLFLTMFVIFGVATFCCSEIRRSGRQLRRIATTNRSFHGRLAALTSAITLAIILMTAGLFVLLPRTARAAFRSLVPDRYHVTGFSNEISLGQIGKIQQSSKPLMHVKIDGVSRHLPLKWRGAALTQFDGKRWYNPPSQNQIIRIKDGMAFLADDDQRRRPGERLTYHVRIDSIEADALFFTGVPEVIHVRLPLLLRTPQSSYRTGFGFGAAQYYATSFRPENDPAPLPVAPLPVDVATEHLLLPEVDRRTIELARSLDPGGTTTDRARLFEKYLRTNFAYTTDLLEQEVSDPLAHFLFERKAGHCEYFASAMAVMLRAVHIPSRVVTGFQSGAYNSFTGWHVLRASDAHSWVEAWASGYGWVTFDPTPPGGSPSGRPWTTLALYLDTVEMFWQRWVVDYDLEHQLYLASEFQRSARGWKGISTDVLGDRLSRTWTKSLATAKIVAPFAGLALLIAAIAFLLLPRLMPILRHRQRARRIRQGGAGFSDAAILYGQMLELLRKRGYEKPGWLTPAEFARVIPESGLATDVSEFTSLYHDLRYGHRTAVGERMLGLLRQIESDPSSRIS